MNGIAGLKWNGEEGTERPVHIVIHELNFTGISKNLQHCSESCEIVPVKHEKK